MESEAAEGYVLVPARITVSWHMARMCGELTHPELYDEPSDDRSFLYIRIQTDHDILF